MVQMTRIAVAILSAALIAPVSAVPLVISTTPPAQAELSSKAKRTLEQIGEAFEDFAVTEFKKSMVEALTQIRRTVLGKEKQCVDRMIDRINMDMEEVVSVDEVLAEAGMVAGDMGVAGDVVIGLLGGAMLLGVSAG